ncbi:MAG: hypothetical protein AB8B69_15355 [Chitinophagales bacterium]
MNWLFKKRDKNAPKNLPTSIQDELSALWGGNTIGFEMEGDDEGFTFILDDYEEE